MGEWDPEFIALNFQHFIQILQQLQLLARGRSNPVDLEAFIEFTERESPDISDFWETLFENET